MRSRHTNTGRNLTSYHKAQLQVVGYRTIQSSVNEVLAPLDLNTSQWIILGWLHEHPAGMRVTALAKMLDVETPLVTTLIAPLHDKRLVHSVTDPLDKRAKLLTLSESGETLVDELEQRLNTHLAFYEQGFKKHELEAYFAALERFIRNADQAGS